MNTAKRACKRLALRPVYVSNTVPVGVGPHGCADCHRIYQSDLFQLLKNIHQQCTFPILLTGSANGWLIHYLVRQYSQVRAYLHTADDISTCLPTALQAAQENRPTLSPTRQLFQWGSPDEPYLPSIYLSPYASTLALETHHRKEHHLDLADQDVWILREMANGTDESLIAAKLAIPRKRVYAVSRRLRRRFEASTNEDLIVRAVRSGVC